MKRFHVHLHVDDLGKSISFYSRLFAAEPARSETDYAKWMLDDPPVNFAISTRGAQPGIDHLGIQAGNAEDLAALQARAEAADGVLEVEGETTCCYARSQKHWVTDPQGIAWEHFHTLANIPVFHEIAAVSAAGGAVEVAGCCEPKVLASASAKVAAPAQRGKPLSISVKSATSCC